MEQVRIVICKQNVIDRFITIVIGRRQDTATKPDSDRTQKNAVEEQSSVVQKTFGKLGGWQPQLEIVPGPGIVTWKKLSDILYEVAKIRNDAQ